MKKFLLLVSVLLVQQVSSQNIVFADVNFKNLLLLSYINYDYNSPIVYPLIDSNNDGEISQQEALLVVKINLGYSGLLSLNGLEYFTNLKVLESNFINISNFNFPTLVNLEDLNLYNYYSIQSNTAINFDFSGNLNLKKLGLANSLIALDLSNNINLIDIRLFCTELVNLNLSNLSNLRSLNYYGKSPTIDLSDCTGLLNLNCYGSSETFSTPIQNKLTSLDVSNQNLLVNLSVSGNNLTSLNLSNNPNLESLHVQNNKITNLDLANSNYIKILNCSNNLLSSLDVNNIFNLQQLYCNNNQLTNLYIKNDIIEEFISFSNNPNLNSVCCDANEIVYTQNQLLLNGNYNAVVSSNCGNSDSNLTVSMFPNPVNDILTMNSNALIDKVEIYGINSLKVMTDQTGSKTINLQSLESGIYFMKVYVGDQISNIKFIKS